MAVNLRSTSLPLSSLPRIITTPTPAKVTVKLGGLKPATQLLWVTVRTDESILITDGRRSRIDDDDKGVLPDGTFDRTKGPWTFGAVSKVTVPDSQTEHVTFCDIQVGTSNKPALADTKKAKMKQGHLEVLDDLWPEA